MRGKEEEIVTMMEEKRLAVLGLCETCWSGAGRKVIHHDFQLIYSGGRENKYGVAIIVSPTIAQRIKKINQIGERLMSMTKNG